MSHRRLHPSLPIFAVQDGAVEAVYVPGHVMPASLGLLEALRHAWDPGTGRLPKSPAARNLERVARDVCDAWGAHHARPYEPVCLNVQFPHVCTLDCGYCFTRPGTESSKEAHSLDRAAVTAAARLVAGNCGARGVAFQLDLQGLGEPSGHWDDLRWVVAMTRELARDSGVAWSGHLSTNGQLASDQAAWVGAHLSHVTLSCDGPPQIQDGVRPCRDGGRSSAGVERTASILREAEVELEARVTITPANADRLGDVVTYLVQALEIVIIRLEPAFAQPGLAHGLPAPELLAVQCLEACDLGASRGAQVSLASPCLLALHGPYCDAARDVLRLTPDGTAVNCLHGDGSGRSWACRVGWHEEASGVFVMDDAAASRLRAACREAPPACRDCLCAYHCTRSCPDACPADVAPEGARCRFQRALAEAWILGAARRSAGLPVTRGHRESADLELREAVASLPQGANRDEIMEQSRRALADYDLKAHEMPAPAWADEGRCERGKAAQETLLDEARQRRGPLAVYVHVPFCRRRCVFCDCHSVVAGQEREDEYARYVARVLADLGTWCDRGGMADRGVSTVHLGGGTPDAVGWRLLAELMGGLRERLATTAETEWALETTARGAAPDRVERLLELGFRRLHVGVQTLDDGLRRRLGRTTASKAVLEHLGAAMSAGMVTSADLLHGLPGQTAGALLDDLRRLAGVGVHGVSLYRLNLSSHNRGLMKRFPDFRSRPMLDLVMLQAAEAMLVRAGYRKNHYVHYALAEDRDVYFRHRVRGEDLLGLGAWAAGSVGALEYVCEGYPGYLEASEAGLPVAAVARQAWGEVNAHVAACLMAGSVARRDIPDAVAVGPLARWLEAGLLVPDGDAYWLTATGSWLIAEMLAELGEG